MGEDHQGLANELWRLKHFFHENVTALGIAFLILTVNHKHNTIYVLVIVFPIKSVFFFATEIPKFDLYVLIIKQGAMITVLGRYGRNLWRLHIFILHVVT